MNLKYNLPAFHVNSFNTHANEPRRWLTCPAAFFFLSSFCIGYNTIICCSLFCDEFNHIIRVCNHADTLAIGLPVNRKQACGESPSWLTNDCRMIWVAVAATNWAYLQLLHRSVLKVSSLRRSVVIDFLSTSLPLPLPLSTNSLLCISVPGTRLPFLPIPALLIPMLSPLLINQPCRQALRAGDVLMLCVRCLLCRAYGCSTAFWNSSPPYRSALWPRTASV